MSKRSLLLFLGLAISGAATYFVLRKTDLHAVGEQLSRIGWGTGLLIALFYCVGFGPRTVRSVLMAKPFAAMKPTLALEAIVLGYTANNLLPLRLGEVVRTLFVAHRARCSKTASLTLVASERLLDALGLAFVLLASLLLLASSETALPATLQRLLLPCSVAVVGGIVAVVLVATLGPKLRILVEKLGKPFALTLLDRILEATAFTRQPRTLALVSLLTLLVWGCEGTVYCMTAHVLDIPHPILAGFLTLSFVNLGVLIPSSPGYIGVFHAAAMFALTPLGVPASTALAMAILCHAIPFVTVTSAGLLVFARHSKLILSDLKETRA